MATISIRVSDDLKAKLEGLAHESGGTISGVVTEALGSMVGSPRTDYPEEMAPLTIAPVNRLILRDQELILAALSEYEEDARLPQAPMHRYSRRATCASTRRHSPRFDRRFPTPAARSCTTSSTCSASSGPHMRTCRR